ncbi:MAG TPA: magnesium/cobalt transporter CorA [Candidatus Polarisedimenticolaceae bacterium]|nr:magnesium/cobalt transporter CorA [Candidatus Polarisedimenticolaceae bacterium]
MKAHHGKRKAWKAKARRHPAPGAPPGLLVADPEAARPVMRAMAYGPQGCHEQQLQSVSELAALRQRWPMIWLNVDGLGDVPTIQAIGSLFGLHRLALEDVVNTGQRAKVEPYDSHLFIVARSGTLAPKYETEQLSVFLGTNFVITFQERPGDCFDAVRNRLRTEGSRIRAAGPDYLVYALFDAVIDAYFPILEQLGDQLEGLENEVIETPGRATIFSIHHIRSTLLALRRDIWPHREALGALQHQGAPYVAAETVVHLRDCLDHTLRLIDLAEVYREVSSDLVNAYLSSTSNRLNEIMKVLTIIATIFIPLSFIASVYGMNFDTHASPWNMPELHWYWGYPLVLLLMAAVAGGLLVWFRIRKWL